MIEEVEQKTTLWSLKDLEQQLTDALEVCEDAEAAKAIVAEALEKCQGDIETKLKRMASLCREKAAEGTMCASEKAHWESRRSAAQNVAESLKTAFYAYLESEEKTVVNAGPFRIRYWTNSADTVVFGEGWDAYDLGNIRYWKPVEVYTSLIAEDIQAGKTVPGCSLVRGKHVRVL